jgi:hypothetical protein
VHGNICLTAKKGILDFLDKESLPADLRQRDILQDISLGFNHNDVNGYIRPLIFKPFCNPVCLRQRQGTAPCADFQRVFNFSISLFHFCAERF